MTKKGCKTMFDVSFYRYALCFRNNYKANKDATAGYLCCVAYVKQILCCENIEMAYCNIDLEELIKKLQALSKYETFCSRLKHCLNLGLYDPIINRLHEIVSSYFTEGILTTDEISTWKNSLALELLVSVTGSLNDDEFSFLYDMSPFLLDDICRYLNVNTIKRTQSLQEVIQSVLDEVYPLPRKRYSKEFSYWCSSQNILCWEIEYNRLLEQYKFKTEEDLNEFCRVNTLA